MTAAFVRVDAVALVFMLALAASPQVHAQDLLAVAPQLAQVEYEDARVRVVRLRIPESGDVAMHDRPRRVVVSLTANDVRITRADGTTSVTRTDAGTVAWSEPAVRSVRNPGAPLENIVVELKQAQDRAKPVAGPPSAPPAEFLDDSFHRWVFENQYVRVYDVRIPPGVTTAFHRHAYDQVVVYVSGGRVSSQVEGQDWSPPTTLEPRSVSFAANATAPLTHRVRNDGPDEYRNIVVQFLK
jgi:hypothetical protein